MQKLHQNSHVQTGLNVPMAKILGTIIVDLNLVCSVCLKINHSRKSRAKLTLLFVYLTAVFSDLRLPEPNQAIFSLTVSEFACVIH